MPQIVLSLGLTTRSPIRPWLIKGLGLPRPDVHLHDIAECVVVGGEVGLLGVRIVGHRGDVVEHGPLDAGEVTDVSGVVERQHPDRGRTPG
jgi:hypothetical protein